MLHRYLTGLLVLIFATLAVPDATKQRTDTKQKQSTTSSAEMRLKKAVEGTEDVRPHSPENTTPLTLGCASSYCNDRELRKKYTINNIQKEILSKLNMKNPPNVTGKNLTFRAGMYDLISRTHPASYPRPVLHHTVDMQNDDPSTYSSSVLYAEEEEEAQFLPKTILISPSKEHTKLRHHTRGGPILMYECHSKTLEENKVQGAYLHMYLRGTGGTNSVNVTITVRKVIRSSSSNGEKLHVVITHTALRPNGTEGEWVSLNVTGLVVDWYKNSKNNLGILIDATPNSDHTSPVILPAHASDKLDEWVPFLEVHTRKAKKRRTRRMIGLTCAEDSTEPRCCRYPLKVDFEAFGWDWIIAPKSYEANFCSGECQHMFLPKYAHTQLVRYTNITMGGPCCAPRKMSHISMLYFDNDLNIIFGYLPNMVVDQCGCA